MKILMIRCHGKESLLPEGNFLEILYKTTLLDMLIARIYPTILSVFRWEASGLLQRIQRTAPPMTIVITAGGLSEPIDSVRSITNSGTGRLGQMTARTFLDSPEMAVGRLFYVCSPTALVPSPDPRLTVIPVRGALELEAAMKKLLTEYPSDIIIHSMAVSDYRVESASTVSSGREVIVDRSSKISSRLDNLTLRLVPTPKIISLLRPLAPRAVIVGFKLLENVPESELIKAGMEILRRNDCDMVLANDLKTIKGDAHRGCLMRGVETNVGTPVISPDGSYTWYEGKQDIARALVEATLAVAGGKGKRT